MNVRETMGKVALQFFEIRDGHYRYTHSDKFYKLHPKWKPHMQWLRGRKYAVVLTQEVQSNSKSGSSYNIIGVLAIFDSLEDLEWANSSYWAELQSVTGDLAKVETTCDYVEWLKEIMYSSNADKNFYTHTQDALKTCALNIKLQQEGTK